MITIHHDVHSAMSSVQDIIDNKSSSASASANAGPCASSSASGHGGLSHDDEFDGVRDRGVEVTRKYYLHLFLLSRTEI